MALLAERIELVQQPLGDGCSDVALSGTVETADIRDPSTISNSIEDMSEVSVDDLPETESPVLPAWACSYCSVHNPQSVMQCLSTGKWFCNAKSLGKVSCIVHHALQSGHREFRVHEVTNLDSLVAGGDIRCTVTGSTNILSLGYISIGNKMVLVSRDVFDLDGGELPAGVVIAEADWAPLIQDKAIVDWLVKHPSASDKKFCRDVRLQDANRLESMWKRGKLSATFADLREVDAPEREEILPVAKRYSEASIYASIFGALVDLEKRTSRYIKMQQTLANVAIQWSTEGQGAVYIAQFVHHFNTGAKVIREGDPIRIKHHSQKWESIATITKHERNTNRVTAKIYSLSRENSPSAGRPPISVASGYCIEFLWEGTPYARMHGALRRFATDDTSMSPLLHQLILGKEYHDISYKFFMDFKLPEDLIAPGLQSLNSSQEYAVRQALSSPLSLIQGPPGTGKTTTAATIVYHLTKTKNGQILVATPSNTAADNVAERIHRTGVRVTRVLSKARERIGSSVDHLTSVSQISDLRDPDIYEFQRLHSKIMSGWRPGKKATKEYQKIRNKLESQVLQSADVICVTCVCAGDVRLSGMRFQSVMIDECTQSSEVESLVPIAKGCEHLVLVGDQSQLGPLVLNRRAEKSGLGQSLFKRLMYTYMSPIRLNMQYRMHPAISSFPSKAFYEGTLENGVSEQDRSNVINFPWPSPNVPLMFWAQRGIEEISDSGVSYLNRAEAIAISGIVRKLLELGVRPSNIGVITPYEGQRVQIVHRCVGTVRGMNMADVEVSNVDSFQGREKDYIIFSCVRSSQCQGIGFLSDPRRLNVSLTRARYGLIIMGNPEVLSKNPLWESLLCHVSNLKALVEGPTLDSLIPCPLTRSTTTKVLEDPVMASMSEFQPVEMAGDCFAVMPGQDGQREEDYTGHGSNSVSNMTKSDRLEVSVKLIFGSKCSGVADEITIHLEKSGEDTIRDVKSKIAEAAGGNITPDDLLLNFGPNDRKIGRQYYGDPTVDEKSIKIKQYSILSWMERFPHWGLSVSLLPPTPPPPGVAIRKAAAIAENKDPDQAVEDARKSGEIPKINDLAAPWGPKDFVPPTNEDLMTDGYLPAVYPESSSPLIDA